MMVSFKMDSESHGSRAVERHITHARLDNLIKEDNSLKQIGTTNICTGLLKRLYNLTQIMNTSIGHSHLHGIENEMVVIERLRT